jgi:hypothetical protein
VGKPEGKRPLGRPRCRCADSIKVDVSCDISDLSSVKFSADYSNRFTMVSFIPLLQMPGHHPN